jgi:SAM-dependent methyltransferase
MDQQHSMQIPDPGETPKLYTELAGWFHLLTAPADYAEEAEFYRQAILSASDQVPQTILELGSGGGNNASHLKAHFQLTLVDLAPQMVQISQGLNPECEHFQGDMRSIRLDRLFDVVFVHDAIGYMRSEEDLNRAIETANVHCRPGGLILLAPDHVKENFRPSTSHGGHDGQQRSIRFLDWTWDPDPGDSTYISDMIYVMKTQGGSLQVEHDRHILGLFPRQTWLNMLINLGLQPQVIPFEHSEIEPGTSEFFLARKISSNKN